MWRAAAVDAAELPPQVALLAGAEANVFLLGTSATGRCAELVRQTAAALNPDVIVCAVCPTRMAALVGGRPAARAPWTAEHWLARQADAVAARCGGLRLWGDGAAAIELCAAQSIRLVVGARDVRTALARAWDALGVAARARLFLEMLRHGLLLPVPEGLGEDPHSDAVTQLVQDVGRRHPGVLGVLDDEAAYMADSLRRLDRPAEELAPGTPGATGRGVVLAVVGQGAAAAVSRAFLSHRGAGDGSGSGSGDGEGAAARRKALAARDRRGGPTLLQLTALLIFVLLTVAWWLMRRSSVVRF